MLISFFKFTPSYPGEAIAGHTKNHKKQPKNIRGTESNLNGFGGKSQGNAMHSKLTSKRNKIEVVFMNKTLTFHRRDSKNV